MIDEPHSVVTRLARTLIADIDNLAAAAVQEYQRALLPGYDRVDPDDLATTATENLRTRLEYLAGYRANLSIRESAASLGRRRCAAGVPLESILRLSRIEARLLWEWFSTAANALNEATVLASLLRDAGEVWDASDEASESIVHAYQEFRQQQLWRDHEFRMQLFDRLTSGTAGPGDVQEFSRVFGMAVHKRYAAVAMLSDDTHTGNQRTVVRLALADNGVHSEWRDYGGYEIALIPLVGASPRRLIDQLAPTGYHFGISPMVDNLSLAHRAVALAKLSLRAASHQHKVRLLVDSLNEVAAQAHLELMGYMSDALSDDFERAGIQQPERLIEAVIAFAEEGTVEKAAARMYVHGNTVRNYFGLISEASGLSLKHAGDAAELITRCYAWRATHTGNGDSQ